MTSVYWHFLNTLIPVLAAAIVAIATVAAAVIARRIPSVDRNHSKRLAVIEIAKKRLEVRDQALQLELAATENGSAEQEEAKVRARKAVQRIISDADSWMEYLEWDSQITRVVTKQPYRLKSRPISGMDRGFYWFLILCGLVSRTIAVVAILSFIPCLGFRPMTKRISCPYY